MTTGFVERLARARIGETFNQYTGSPLRRERLAAYLAARADAPLLLVAEAPGYRGTRVSGIPLTSERQLTGTGPAEATATIVHRTLAELGIEDDVVLWNIVPTHPGTETVEPAADEARGRGERARSSASSPRDAACWRSAGSRRAGSAARSCVTPPTAAQRRSAPASPQRSVRVGR